MSEDNLALAKRLQAFTPGRFNEIILGLGLNASDYPNGPAQATGLVQWAKQEGRLGELRGLSNHTSGLIIGRRPALTQHFEGRVQVLEDIRDSLQENKSTVIHALAGLGGIGKTTLARKYVEERAGEYGCVLWIKADDETTLQVSFSRIFNQLVGMEYLKAQPDLKPEEKLEQVVGWIQSRGSWLMVFDNVEDPPIIKPYTKLSGGRLLVTSRYQDWGNISHKLQIDVWEPFESVSFLLKRVSKWSEEDIQHWGLDSQFGFESVQHSQITPAYGLACELGHLPLALEQAAAFMDTENMGLKEYLEEFRESRRDLWGEENAPENYEHTVATTWSISISKIRENIPEASNLLELLSLFAPENFPKDVLHTYAEFLPESLSQCFQKKSGVRKVVKALRNYSLIHDDSGFISTHRMTQAVVRDSMQKTKGAFEERCGDTLRFLDKVFENQKGHESWELKSSLLSHAEVCLEHSKKIKETEERALAQCKLLHELGTYTHNAGLFSLAYPFQTQVLEKFSKLLGEDHSSTLTAMGNLALTLYAQGDLKAAEKLQRQVLEKITNLLGEDHPSTLTSMNNLALTLKTRGNLKEAAQLFRKVLEKRTKLLSDDHPSTLNSTHNLADTIYAQGDLKEAAQLQREVLEKRHKLLGEDHPSTFNAMNNLAVTLKSQGDLEGARELLCQVLEKRRKLLGEDHPSTLNSTNNFASVLSAQGNLKEAEELCREVLEKRHKLLGEDHPHTLTSMHNLAGILHDQDNWKDAAHLCRKVLEKRTKLLGEDHPSTLNSINDLAGALRAQGNLKEAEELCREVLEKSTKLLGDDHPDTLTAMNNLANTLYEQGKKQQARTLSKKMKRIQARNKLKASRSK